MTCCPHLSPWSPRDFWGWRSCQRPGGAGDWFERTQVAVVTVAPFLSHHWFFLDMTQALWVLGWILWQSFSTSLLGCRTNGILLVGEIEPKARENRRTLDHSESRTESATNLSLMWAINLWRPNKLMFCILMDSVHVLCLPETAWTLPQAFTERSQCDGALLADDVCTMFQILKQL